MGVGMKYQFNCPACRTIIEMDFRMKDKPQSIVCPNCGGKAKTEISSVTVIYNGSGFASTDIPRKSGLEGYEY